MEKSAIMTRTFKLLVDGDVSIYRDCRNRARMICEKMKEEGEYDSETASRALGEFIRLDIDAIWDNEHEDEPIWDDIMKAVLCVVDWAEIARGFVEEIEEDDVL